MKKGWKEICLKDLSDWTHFMLLLLLLQFVIFQHFERERKRDNLYTVSPLT